MTDINAHTVVHHRVDNLIDDGCPERRQNTQGMESNSLRSEKYLKISAILKNIFTVQSSAVITWSNMI